jgi:hypothetical protein
MTMTVGLAAASLSTAAAPPIDDLLPDLGGPPPSGGGTGAAASVPPAALPPSPLDASPTAAANAVGALASAERLPLARAESPPSAATANDPAHSPDQLSEVSLGVRGPAFSTASFYLVLVGVGLLGLVFALIRLLTGSSHP